MTKYIIKVTYLEGIHAGKEHYLIKGGYVCPNLEYVWKEDAYTLAAAKAVCTRYAKQNALNVRFERQDREYAIKHGRAVSEFTIYTPKSYEPFAIETVNA